MMELPLSPLTQGHNPHRDHTPRDRDVPSSEQMRMLQQEAREIHEQLAAVEKQIFEAEEQYLVSTPHGNAIKGWEGLLENRPQPNQKRKAETKERLFTFSSYSFWRVFIRYHKEQKEQKEHREQQQQQQHAAAAAAAADAVNASVGGGINHHHHLGQYQQAASQQQFGAGIAGQQAMAQPPAMFNMGMNLILDHHKSHKKQPGKMHHKKKA